MTSLELAAFIGKQRDNGTGNLVLAIGGAYGFSEDFRRRGSLFSLSKMTFYPSDGAGFMLEQVIELLQY